MYSKGLKISVGCVLCIFISMRGVWIAPYLAGFKYIKEGDNAIKSVLDFAGNAQLDPDWMNRLTLLPRQTTEPPAGKIASVMLLIQGAFKTISNIDKPPIAGLFKRFCRIERTLPAST